MEYFLGFVFICLVLGAIGIYKRDKAKESEVVEEEPIKEDVINISEPVISFLKVFNENPKRFKLEERFTRLQNPEAGFNNGCGYNLTDNILKESWAIELDQYHQRPRTVCTKIYSDTYFGWPEWMTREEREYVFLNLRSYYINRRNTRDTLIKDRAKRIQDKERARLMKLYCKESV
jgi:hypothetical protein